MGYKDYDNSLYEYRVRLAKIKGRRWNLIFGIKDDRISVRANPYHDPTNGRFTSKGGGGIGGKSLGAKYSEKYARSKQRNRKGKQISPKRYARLCGTLNTRYPGLKAGEKRIIRDVNYTYEVTADGFGGMSIDRYEKNK